MVSARARVVACALAGALVLSAVPASAAPTKPRRARQAAGYIARNQARSGAVQGFSTIGTTSDAVLALVAAKRGKRNIRRALNFLARKTRNDKLGTDAGTYGKVIMAVVAGRRNPRRFGGVNLVRRLRSFEQEDGSLGESVQVFSHALGMLGLVAAGPGPSAQSVQWLVDAQCGNGGWAFDEPPAPDDDENCVSGEDDFTSADTNTTAVALMALLRAGEDPVVSPFPYFRSLRDRRRGGWGFADGFTKTDANSTSLVMMAYLAARKKLPRGAMRALTGLQVRLCGRNAGAFRFLYGKKNPPDVGATIAAVPALMKKTLPLRPAKVARSAPKAKRC